MYEAQTYDAILQRLLDAAPSDVDKREGSFIYDALAPAALELAQAYVALDQILQIGFVQTAYDNYLDLKASEFGITRKAAVAATGTVTVTGTAGILIPAGTVSIPHR